jgi:hypothetical protein
MSRGLTVLSSLALATPACAPEPTPGPPECAGPLLPGDLVLTEVMADLPGEDDGREWFELYNATDAAIDLAGLVLIQARADGVGQRQHTIQRGTVAPGGYFVVGGVLDPYRDAHVDYGYAADLGSLRNRDGLLALSCRGLEIDCMRYGASQPGLSLALDGALTPDYQVNDDPKSWCVGRSGYGVSGEFGTPGSANDLCPRDDSCQDGAVVRAPRPPRRGDLIITEVMANPAKVADPHGEWFEVYVANEVDLDGLQVGTAIDKAASLSGHGDCLRVEAGSLLLFARSSDPAQNGGLPAPSFEFGFGLSNRNGSLVLGHRDRIVDQIRWDNARAGQSLAVDPDAVDSTATDDPRSLCAPVSAYGAGDLGTPGAVNDPCQGAGECWDGPRLRPVQPPRVGDLVISEVMPNPSGAEPAGEWFEVTVRGSVDLAGLEYGRSRESLTDRIPNDRCEPVEAGAVILFARSSDPAQNGGLPAPDWPVSFGLVNRNGALVIARAGTILDEITWGAAVDGASFALDPRYIDPTANDDLASWCPSTAVFGHGDRGSPGLVNSQRCPP